MRRAGKASAGSFAARFHGDDRLPTCTTVTLGYGGSCSTLKLNGHSQTLGGLTTCGTSSCNKVVNGSTTAGSLKLNYSSGTQTFSGILGGGMCGTADENNFSLIKTGGGTLGLTGANTYTGATSIVNGTISLDGGHNRLSEDTVVSFGDAKRCCGKETRLGAQSAERRRDYMK
ncbi:MAG: autotransporter-associated beta strand repeat-containing protein [Planctomycetota bacterium]|nr:autotransporter-associated beta strand repeat-containing protein [Planctomycetota bacterium]